RLGPAASSRTPLALPATVCSVPPVPPERTGQERRRGTLHRTASEPLDPSSPGTGVLLRIDQRNCCTLPGVVHRRVIRQGFPCATLLCASVVAVTTALGRSHFVGVGPHAVRPRIARTIQISKHAPMNPVIR